MSADDAPREPTGAKHASGAAPRRPAGADDASGAVSPGATGPPAGRRFFRALRPSAAAAAFRAGIGVPLTGAAFRATARAPAPVAGPSSLRAASRLLRRAR
jgi:hypothetical protein